MSGYHPINNPFYYVQMYRNQYADASQMRQVNRAMSNGWLSPSERHAVNTCFHFYEKEENWSKPLPQSALNGLAQAYKRNEPH